eukprot:5279315-Prymnesium_polylepis.1
MSLSLMRLREAVLRTWAAPQLDRPARRPCTPRLPPCRPHAPPLAPTRALGHAQLRSGPSPHWPHMRAGPRLAAPPSPPPAPPVLHTA